MKYIRKSIPSIFYLVEISDEENVDITAGSSVDVVVVHNEVDLVGSVSIDISGGDVEYEIKNVRNEGFTITLSSTVDVSVVVSWKRYGLEIFS